MTQALRAAQQRGAEIEITWLAGQTVNDLQRALRWAEQEPVHIFHFVGHGSFDAQRDEGVLWLADEQGRARALTASQLARLLGDHRALRLAALNACEGARGSVLDVFSSTAATLVRRGIPQRCWRCSMRLVTRRRRCWPNGFTRVWPMACRWIRLWPRRVKRLTWITTVRWNGHTGAVHACQRWTHLRRAASGFRWATTRGSSATAGQSAG